MRPESLKYLFDMQEACRLLKQFVAAKTLVDYDLDALPRSAVERQFLTIGEALNRLAKTEPEIVRGITDARQIIAFRNILVHGYNVIRHEVVWGVLENDLPTLTREITDLLAEGSVDDSST